MGSKLVLQAVIITAVTCAVTVEVTRVLAPAPSEVLSQFEPALNAREIFESELRSVDQTRGGLRSILYTDVMQERGAVDSLYAKQRWNAAQAGYAALSQKIDDSCHGSHPTMTPIPGLCARPGARAMGSLETSRSTANTWTNYTDAAGALGPSIVAGNTVEIACKVSGFAVADGNTWWYRIASGPWSGRYYVSADAFYNSGKMRGTELRHSVDLHVQNCSSR
jgi:hypothetical protein